MKTLNSLRKDGHVTFCPPPNTGEAALPTNSRDATLDDIYLTLPQNHIRLLRLQNTVEIIDITHSSESLQCELAVFSLDLVPSYVALSYCWGGQGTTYPLTCWGQELQIQENLHAVLARLHEVGFQDWLWVDAVCINQLSDDEKNHQIPLMRNIFSQAHMVLGWLGEAPEGLRESWEVMQRLPAALTPLKNTIGPVPLGLQCPSASSEKLWPVLAEVFGRSFFKRLWIVQEIVLAQTVSLLCGDLLFNWNDLIPIAKAIREDCLWTRGWFSQLFLAVELPANCSTICLTNEIREVLNSGKFCSGPFLSTITQNLEVTDLRDKVYGFLGLVPKLIQDEIEVDVGKSNVIVYTEFSRSLLKFDKSTGLLQRAGVASIEMAGLPSWCIDFSQNERNRRLTKTKSFKAGRRKGLSPCIEFFDVGSSEPLLALSGWRVDCITEVVECSVYWIWGNSNMELTDAARKWEDDALQISRAIFNAPDDDIPEEHWRTITGDRGGDKMESRREEYLEWRQSLWDNCKDCSSSANKQEHNSPPRTMLSAFGNDVNSTCHQSRFYSTKGGRIGIGPRDTEPGDFVCIPYQSHIPYIMRRNDANGRYKLLGDTYCSGVMHGEIFDMGDELKAMEVRFVID